MPMHWDQSLEFMWHWETDPGMQMGVNHAIKLQTLINILALNQDRKEPVAGHRH